MADAEEKWTLYQFARSEFFRQKLDDWQLMEIRDELDDLRGENYRWEDRKKLGISDEAWKLVVHRGIKPLLVFAHPDVLSSIGGAVAYYRMLSMVSQKSMQNVRLTTKTWEKKRKPPGEKRAAKFARHLNRITSKLVENSDDIAADELDLWRTMAAGAQADGIWRNLRGDRGEEVVKGLIRQRVLKQELAADLENVPELDEIKALNLWDGRTVTFGSDPDVTIKRGSKLEVAIEVKAGIDKASANERISAAMKTLGRVKSDDESVVTVLVAEKELLTESAQKDAAREEKADHTFFFDNLVEDSEELQKFFEKLSLKKPSKPEAPA